MPMNVFQNWKSVIPSAYACVLPGSEEDIFFIPIYDFVEQFLYFSFFTSDLINASNTKIQEIPEPPIFVCMAINPFREVCAFWVVVLDKWHVISQRHSPLIASSCSICHSNAITYSFLFGEYY